MALRQFLSAHALDAVFSWRSGFTLDAGASLWSVESASSRGVLLRSSPTCWRRLPGRSATRRPCATSPSSCCLPGRRRRRPAATCSTAACRRPTPPRLVAVHAPSTACRHFRLVAPGHVIQTLPVAKDPFSSRAVSR